MDGRTTNAKGDLLKWNPAWSLPMAMIGLVLIGTLLMGHSMLQVADVVVDLQEQVNMLREEVRALKK